MRGGSGRVAMAPAIGAPAWRPASHRARSMPDVTPPSDRRGISVGCRFAAANRAGWRHHHGPGADHRREGCVGRRRRHGADQIWPLGSPCAHRAGRRPAATGHHQDGRPLGQDGPGMRARPCGGRARAPRTDPPRRVRRRHRTGRWRFARPSLPAAARSVARPRRPCAGGTALPRPALPSCAAERVVSAGASMLFRWKESDRGERIPAIQTCWTIWGWGG